VVYKDKDIIKKHGILHNFSTTQDMSIVLSDLECWQSPLPNGDIIIKLYFSSKHINVPLYVLFFVLSLKSPFHSTGTRIQSSEMAQPVSQIPLLIQKIKLKLKLMSDKYHLI